MCYVVYCYISGRATLSAAMGLVAQVAGGATALREATAEIFEGGEVPQPPPSRQASRLNEARDSDDEV